MFRLRIALVAVIVMIAACGGDAEPAADDGGGTDDGTTSSTTTTTSTTATTTTTVVTSGDGFCQFAADNADNLNASFSPTQSPEQLRDSLLDTQDRISRAVDLAPAEIKDDVRVFEAAYDGLIEVFEEIEWSFANAPDDLDQDPRLQALDSPELEEAGMRIEDYCGFSFIATEPGGGGTGTVGGGTVPDDFPSDLIVADAEIVAVVNIGGADSVTFDVQTDVDTVIAFYTDLLGDPAGALEEPPGALWITTWEGRAANVTVVEVPGGTTQVNVTLG